MDVCGDHGIRIACPRCVRMNFDSEEVYERRLTANDMMTDRNRLPLGVLDAQRICPEAFVDPPPNETKEPYINGALSFCDINFKRWPMSFQRRPDNKCYLFRGWREFVEAKGLKEGHVIKIREYTNRGTGARFFTIGLHVALFGEFIG